MAGKLIPLRKLNHLVGLVEAGSFAKAALALHLSQPALSRSIDALEAELGVPLVDRSYGKVRLTAQGELVLERARRMQRELREMRRDLGLAKQGAIGQVRAGFGPFAAATILQPALARLVQAQPQLRVEIEVDDEVSALVERLRSERLDLFIADTRDVPRSTELHIDKLPAVPAAFVVSSSHPLARARQPAVDRLLDHPVATPRLPPTVLRFFEAQLTRRDRGLSTVVCNDLTTLRALALHAGAVVLVPARLGDEPGLRRLDVGHGALLQTRYGIVTLARRRLSPAVQVFLQAVREVAASARASQSD